MVNFLLLVVLVLAAAVMGRGEPAVGAQPSSAETNVVRLVRVENVDVETLAAMLGGTSISFCLHIPTSADNL